MVVRKIARQILKTKMMQIRVLGKMRANFLFQSLPQQSETRNKTTEHSTWENYQ